MGEIAIPLQRKLLIPPQPVASLRIFPMAYDLTRKEIMELIESLNIVAPKGRVEWTNNRMFMRFKTPEARDEYKSEL